MIQLQNIIYTHPNKDILFDKISLTIQKQEKIALVGNNGVGKSTLLKIITRNLLPINGSIIGNPSIHFIPQIYGSLDEMTVAEAIGIKHKLDALYNISQGSVNEEDFQIIGDDWLIEDQYYQAVKYWGLCNISPDTEMKNLSGGEKTKVFLSAINIVDPTFIIMDEPTNHLDYSSRQQLYDFIAQCNKTLLIVSHDRTLLNLLSKTWELTPTGIIQYGGNYNFYAQQKLIDQNALSDEVLEAQKELRKAQQKEKETRERQYKLDARGQKKQEKAGVARIMMNTLKNKAENSSSKQKSIHQEKTSNLLENLKNLQSNLPELDKIKFNFLDSNLHKGKILVELQNINIKFKEIFLWEENINWKIRSGDRIAIEGNNGIGKTSLLKIILGLLRPSIGNVKTFINKAAYIDQNYDILQQGLCITELAQNYNTGNISLSEVNTRLKRFLFHPTDWNKKVEDLSGGERLRLILCCLTIQEEAPDILILDEPTNNLDLQNINILTKAIESYKGTLLVISHDKTFLNDIAVKDSFKFLKQQSFNT